MTQTAAPKYSTFRDFYPFYLSEHANRTCRLLHLIGSSLVLLCLVALMVTGDWRFLIAMPFCGYGFAWLGHFFFEKNRPATFTYPLYSFMGDWVMFKDMLTGKIKI